MFKNYRITFYMQKAKQWKHVRTWNKCRCSILLDKDAFTRPHGRRRRSEKSSQGQWARNKFNGARVCAPGSVAHTGLQWESEFIRTHTRIVTEKRGLVPMRLRIERKMGGRKGVKRGARQAGTTCEVFHAVHLDDSGRGLSGCPRDKRPRLA